MSAARYHPPEGLRILPFDTSAREPCFLAEAGGRRWQINEGTVDLLRALDGGASLACAAAALEARWGRPVEVEGLSEFVVRELVPRGIVREEGSTSAPRSEREFGGRLAYLSLRRTIVPARVLEVLSWPLRLLVSPRLFWPLSLTLLTGGIWAGYAALARMDGASLLLMMLAPEAILLGMAGTVVHELGHAAACRRFGCRHGDLGFGIYLVFPVLYMEVDESWRLPRGERAIVAAAGIYFQFLFGVLLLVAAVADPAFAPVALGAFGLIFLDLLVNLNPLLRFDGYWVVSDLLGIPNLRLKSAALLSAGWRRLRGLPDAGAELLPGGLPRGLTVALAAYTAATLGFFAFFFARLVWVLPRFAFEIYPALMARKAADFAGALRGGEYVAAAAEVFAMVPPTAMVAGMGLGLVLAATRLTRMMAARRRASPHDSPVTRTSGLP